MDELNLPKVVVIHPDIDKFGHVRVKPGKVVDLTITVKNRSDVIDAFAISLLGVEQGNVTTIPAVLSLFPDAQMSASVEFTVPSDFAAGSTTLWVKATSLTDPSMQTLESLEVTVGEVSDALIEIDPSSLVARRLGRFGVTVQNTGNTPLDLLYAGDDPENHFTMRFVPADPPPIEPGTSASIQAIVHGRRGFTGSPLQRQFEITARARGFEKTVSATLAQRPYVPGLVLMLAAVLVMFGLWAVVVGAAIDSIIDDTDSDIAASLEEGIDAAVDNLVDPSAEAEALDKADELIASAVTTTPPAFRGQPLGASSAIAAAEDLAAQVDAAEPVIEAPSDALIGSVVVAADGDLNTPVAGVSVVVQALVEDEPVRGDADPNVQPVELTSDETGRYQLFDMISGLYSVTFTANGFVPVICDAVTVPTTPTRPLGDCTTNTAPLDADPGRASMVRLIGESASIAGIVTFEGIAQPGAQVAVARLDPVTGTASDPVARTTGADGRFDVAFARSVTDPKTPGTFEVVVNLTRPALGDIPEQTFMPNRLVVPLAGDEHKIGIEFAMAPETPTTTTTTTTTTLPAAERTLFGRVEDASLAVGNSLPNAEIQISGVSNTYFVSSLDNGSYYQDGLATGEYNLRVSAPGYVTASLRVTVPQTSGSVIRLERSLVALSGRVIGLGALDADPVGLLPLGNVPIGGALISVGNSVVATTDGNGEWRTTRAFGRTPVVVEVSAPGYATRSVTAAPAPPNDFRVSGAIELVPIDSWASRVSTNFSASLPRVELACGADGNWAAPGGPTPSVSATWTPASGSTNQLVMPLSATLVDTGAATEVVLVNVPRSGSLTLTFNDVQSGLLTSTITIPELGSPGMPLSLPLVDFVGIRDSAGLPVLDVVAGGPCPMLVATPAVASGARSLVLRGLEVGRPTYVVTNLEPGNPITVMTTTVTVTATPVAGVPFTVLTM